MQSGENMVRVFPAVVNPFHDFFVIFL
jgi:hypothetical protein